MKFKNGIIILIISVFVFLSIAGVCAGDVNDTAITDEGITQSDEAVQETDTSDNEPLKASENDETIKDNTLLSSETGHVYNNTFYDFFDDVGHLRGDVTYESLTFHGQFSNLGNGNIVINRPIALIGDNAVLDGIKIDILNGNVEICGFSFISNTNCIYISALSDVSIVKNTFDVTGRSSYSTAVIDISDSQNLRIDGNWIRFTVDSDKTNPNKIINAENCQDISISNNFMIAFLPARPINWNGGEIYSEGVSLYGCRGVRLTNNTIGVGSSGNLGEYAALYGVHITGENVNVSENMIGVIGAPYCYSLVISADEFDVCANMIFAGLDFSGIMENADLSFFKTKSNSNKDTAELFDDIIAYTESQHIKDYLPELALKDLTSYACAIEVDGYSKGTVGFNLIATAAAVSSYGIYTASWEDDVKLKSVLNLILGYANSAFGMSLSGSRALVEYSLIFVGGNFTTGIASAVSNININHVGIEALGSDEGVILGYDPIGIETVCIHIGYANANIKNNRMNSSGENAIDFKGSGEVSDNYLVARKYTGDASVDCDESEVILKNNVPEWVKIKTQITAKPVVTTYDVNGELIITLTDNNSLPMEGVKLTVDLNGIKTYTSDANGQVKLFTSGLLPKSYTAKISYKGNRFYAASNLNVNIVVKKLTLKLIVKKKIKLKSKKKKFTVTLKGSAGKPIKSLKVTLKVKKKVQVKKTNRKGKVTFKLKKFKKGKYRATVKFKGNTYYASATKKVKIIIR